MRFTRRPRGTATLGTLRQQTMRIWGGIGRCKANTSFKISWYARCVFSHTYFLTVSSNPPSSVLYCLYRTFSSILRCLLDLAIYSTSLVRICLALIFPECSAKHNRGVNEVFHEAARVAMNARSTGGVYGNAGASGRERAKGGCVVMWTRTLGASMAALIYGG